MRTAGLGGARACERHRTPRSSASAARARPEALRHRQDSCSCLTATQLLRRFLMRTHHLASLVLVAGALAGCATDGSSGDDGTGGGDDGDVPFTKGTSTLAGM